MTRSRVAEIGAWVSASVGKNFMPHCRIRHDRPRPSVRMSNFHSESKTWLKPSLPSSTCSGPV